MSKDNVLLGLMGLSMLFLLKKYSNHDVVEKFIDVPRMAKPALVKSTGPRKGDMVEIPGTFQALLSPRGGAGMVQYGSNITYNMPANGNLATPMYSQAQLRKNDFANMVITEGYRPDEKTTVEPYDRASQAGCRVGGNSSSASQFLGTNLVPSNFAQGNFNQKESQLKYVQAQDMLPVRGMGGSDGGALNALGEGEIQPIIYDRFMFANQKSFLHGLGDHLRGDLAIVPNCTGWFQPSAIPQNDLRSGAIAVMSGIGNQSGQEMLAFKAALSGSSNPRPAAGVNYSVQKNMFAGGAGGDISVTAFP
jgi:hypothetical protein